MNKTFTEVASAYRVVEKLSHQQRVTRLYRKSLRTVDNWAMDREIFHRESAKIRAQFEANKKLDATSGLVQRLVREAEEKVGSWTHPDPYTVPYMPGGSKFMRNPALPLKAVFPEGVPDEYNIASQTVTYVQVPMSSQPEGPETVLVDVAKKTWN